MYSNCISFFCKVKIVVILFLVVLVQFSQAQSYDLLIKGGMVIDPKNKINSVKDIAIKNGKIVEIANAIDSVKAIKTINARGLYVSPGLIDMHVHAFAGSGDADVYIADGFTSVFPDGFTFRSGVTTIVDAGSSGWRNFRQFKKQIIDRSQTRVLALLNIVGLGMKSRFEEQDKSDMNPQQVAYMINKLYPQLLVGIKSAHYWGDFSQVDLAVQAGNLAKVPVMVDFGEHDPPNSIEDLFMKHLRPGDIFTHTFSYGVKGRESVVDEQAKVKPFVFEAQKRGIVFDVGHGGGAFSFSQAIPSFQQGFYPNVISTDLHTESMNGGMKNLNNVMSKFLNMGMSMEDVITRVTWNPAKVIHREELGNLSIGAEADLTILSILSGRFGFTDVRKTKIEGNQKIETELTLRAGKVVWDLNGISMTAWEAESKAH
jgi:dihydroorotase